MKRHKCRTPRLRISPRQRECFRCGRRQDKCRAQNCLPLEFALPAKSAQAFVAKFDGAIDFPRRASECWDVEIMKHWG